MGRKLPIRDFTTIKYIDDKLHLSIIIIFFEDWHLWICARRFPLWLLRQKKCDRGEIWFHIMIEANFQGDWDHWYKCRNPWQKIVMCPTHGFGLPFMWYPWTLLSSWWKGMPTVNAMTSHFNPSTQSPKYTHPKFALLHHAAMLHYIIYRNEVVAIPGVCGYQHSYW